MVGKDGRHGTGLCKARANNLSRRHRLGEYHPNASDLTTYMHVRATFVHQRGESEFTSIASCLDVFWPSMLNVES